MSAVRINVLRPRFNRITQALMPVGESTTVRRLDPLELNRDSDRREDRAAAF